MSVYRLTVENMGLSGNFVHFALPGTFKVAFNGGTGIGIYLWISPVSMKQMDEIIYYFNVSVPTHY